MTMNLFLPRGSTPESRSTFLLSEEVTLNSGTPGWTFVYISQTEKMTWIIEIAANYLSVNQSLN